MPHFFASNLRAVALPARTKNFEFIFEAKSVRDESAIIFAKSLAKSLYGEQKILLIKQKKGERLLVKFNKHFAPHSKEIIKSALKEYAELAGAEIASHNLNENKIKVDSAYLLDWRGVCTLLGENSSLGLQFCTKNAESNKNSPSLSTSGARGWVKTPSLRDSAKQNRGNPQISSLRADSQNLRGKTSECEVSCNPPIEKTQKSQSGLPRSLALARNDDSILDSAESQNLGENNSCEVPENSPASWCKKSGEASSSASADFLLEAEKRGSPSKSKKRSFWRVEGAGREVQPFLRKESSELSRENSVRVAESNADSVNSQNLQNGWLLRFARKSCGLPRERSSLAMTDFGGLQETSHSLVLPRRFCESARNDEFIRDSSPTAQNNKILKSPQAEFACLEIGFGSGRHILHLAQKHPNARIIGLEIYRPAISQVLRQIEILGLQNLYVASLDARVLCEVLPAKCLDRIYLHFPVPWLKNPQRRVISAQFLGNAMRALKDDGFFELLTDSAEYFAFAKALAGDYKFVAEEGAEGEVVSKYEARWRRQEKVIYKLCVYPVCGNSPLGLQFHTCEKNAESTLDSALFSPLTSLDSLSQKGCTPHPAPPTRQKLPLFAFRGRASLSPLLAKNQRSHYCSLDFDFLHHEAGEFSVVLTHGFNVDSAISQNLGENGGKVAESNADSANHTPFSPTKICKKEYFLHIKNKYIFEGGVVLFASFGAYYAPSSAYFVICGDCVYTISEIIPTSANIDAVELFMELCFDN